MSDAFEEHDNRAAFGRGITFSRERLPQSLVNVADPFPLPPAAPSITAEDWRAIRLRQDTEEP